MKRPSFILRIVAFVLIILFSQKTGAGLFYHNLFHTKAGTEMPADKNQGYSCSCIDDFLMPFEEATVAIDPIICIQPLTTSQAFNDDPSFRFILSPLLRGPPSYILS
jgi:hypothetical protein